MTSEHVKVQLGRTFFSFDLGVDKLGTWLDFIATVFIRASQVTAYHIALKLGQTCPVRKCNYTLLCGE